MKDYDSFLKSMGGYTPEPPKTFDEPEEAEPQEAQPENDYMPDASEAPSSEPRYDTGYADAQSAYSQPQPDASKRYSAADYETSSYMSGGSIPLWERINASRSMTEERVLPGLIGSLIGAALGTAIWCLIGMTGYIAWIGALAIVAGAFFGYLLPAKDVGRLGALLIGIIIIASVYVGNRMTFSIQLNRELIKAQDELELTDDEIPSVTEIFKDANYYIDALGIRSDYNSDMAISYGITAVASIAFFVRRKQKGSF